MPAMAARKLFRSWPLSKLSGLLRATLLRAQQATLLWAPPLRAQLQKRPAHLTVRWQTCKHTPKCFELSSCPAGQAVA